MNTGVSGAGNPPFTLFAVYGELKMKQKIKMTKVHKYAKSRLGYSCGQGVSPYETAKKALEADGFKFPSATTFKRWVINNYDYIVAEADKVKAETVAVKAPACAGLAGKKARKAAQLFAAQMDKADSSKMTPMERPHLQPRPAPRPFKPSTQSSVKAFISHSGIDPNTDAFLQSFEWSATRMMAFKQYGTACQCCGASPKTGAVLNVDHIKPRKLFPELALDIKNLQVLCGPCNKGKGNWDQTDWREAA